ncbi:hypothetical protein ACU4HD_34730 [Cupriavidus basilensis]
MLSWGGFSARALAQKESPLQRLYDGGARLSRLLDLDERASGMLAPAFGPEGIPRSDVTLVSAGQPAGRLVYPRSARSTIWLPIAPVPAKRRYPLRWAQANWPRPTCWRPWARVSISAISGT